MGRTKVDALKDLGNKLTGSTLATRANETVVGMIDKITSNYEGGGSGTEEILLEANMSWLSGEEVTITDTEIIAQLERFRDLYLNKKSVKLGFVLDNKKLYCINTGFGSIAGNYNEFEFLSSNTVLGVLMIYLHEEIADENSTWKITITNTTGQE